MTKLALVSTSANQQKVLILNIVYHTTNQLESSSKLPDPSAYSKINFIISQLKHIVCVWVFKSTASLDHSFQHSKCIFKLSNKNIMV